MEDRVSVLRMSQVLCEAGDSGVKTVDIVQYEAITRKLKVAGVLNAAKERFTELSGQCDRRT